MPTTTPEGKVSAVKQLGARVIQAGIDFEAAQTACLVHLRDHPERVLVHPFDDRAVVAGQGTVSLEIFEALTAKNAKASHVFMPVGGGGLLAGAVLASRETNDSVQLFGAEPDGSAAYAEAHLKQKRTRLGQVKTMAEGAAVRQIGKVPYQILKSAPNAQPSTVSESALLHGMVELNEYLERPVECTAALGFTAMQRYASEVGFAPNDVVVAVITGRHRDEASYAQLQQARRNRLTMAS